MRKGKTESGFEYEIDEGILDDYELLEMLCQIDEGEIAPIFKMVNRLLGKEQKEKLMEHIRDQSGRVSVTKMINEIMGIINAIKEGKNS